MKRVLTIWLLGLVECVVSTLAPGADLVGLVRQAKPAILQLYPLDSNGDPIGQATAFFCSNSGLALTNYHVIQGAADIAARSLSGTRYRLDGYYRVRGLEIAVLHFKAEHTYHSFCGRL